MRESIQPFLFLCLNSLAVNLFCVCLGVLETIASDLVFCRPEQPVRGKPLPEETSLFIS